MRKVFPVICLLAVFLASGPASAQLSQRIPFASSPNPVGSGARAIGWGSAYMAIADDATAASWNPGGLVQLVRPEASVVLSYHNRNEDLDFDGLDTKTDSRSLATSNLNYASVVYPFHVAEMNMVVSLNYQRMFEFDRDLNYGAKGIQSNAGNDLYEEEEWKMQQSGALTTITPAYCIQITPAWSLGMAVNFWGLDDESNGWDMQLEYDTDRSPLDPLLTDSISWSTKEENYEISGTNFVVGTHYKIQNFTIAGVYKSSFESDVNFKSELISATLNPENPADNVVPTTTTYDFDQTIVWPESWGVGVGYRYSDRLSFALDAYLTRWSQYEMKGEDEDGDNYTISLLTGSDDTADVSDTTQIKVGAEYLWILPKYVFALRGGGFYDPEPLADEINDFYGLAVGGGVVYRNFVVDAAIQYKWANDFKGELIERTYAKTDVQDYLVIVSLVYHIE
jgi:long-chain fatty acid transport protein